MRPDFGKVVTERPRRGSSVATAKTGVHINDYDPEYGDRRIDNLPSHEPMYTYGYEGKEFSDVLGPVRGLLANSVGKNWNKLKSECFKQLNTTYPARHVLFTHLLEEVEEDIHFVKEGKIKVVCDTKGKKIYSKYYAHPTTGVLMRTPTSQIRRYKRELTPTNSHGHKWLLQNPCSFDYNQYYHDKDTKNKHGFLQVSNNQLIMFIGNSWVIKTYDCKVETEHLKTVYFKNTYYYDKTRTIYTEIKSKVLSKKEIEYYELKDSPYRERE